MILTDFYREPNILVDPEALKRTLQTIGKQGPTLEDDEMWQVLRVHPRAGQVPMSVKLDGQRYAIVAKNPVLAPRLDLSQFVTSVEASAAGSRWGIQVQLHKDVAERVAALTGPHVGFRGAIIVNGTIVLAPTIREKLGNPFSISGAFSQLQAEAIAGDLDIRGQEREAEASDKHAVQPTGYSSLGGNWIVREVIGLTVEERKSPLPNAATVLIRDNVMEVTNGRYRFERTSFVLSGERDIDMLQHRTNQTYIGLTQLKGNTLRIRLIDRTRGAKDAERPASFVGDDDKAAFTVISQR